jgi:putative ABC transport system permease protein
MRDWKSEVRARLRDLRIEPVRHAQIVDELSDHLADRRRALIARGMSDESADRAVLQELSDGDILAREIDRATGRIDPEPPVSGGPPRRHWAGAVWQDVRYGVRVLRRSPGFTAVAAITLALGVGANTAIFTVVNAVVLRPLPYTEPDRLIRVWESNPAKGWPQFSASHPTFLDWRAQARSFERLAAQTGAGFTLTSGGDAEIVRAIAVTSDFLPVLAVAPTMGRNFRPEEDRPGGRTTVVIVTHGFWERRLGANPSVLGTPITLDGTPYEVVGVLPKEFPWGAVNLDLLVPLAPDPARPRGDHRLTVIGRLRSGVSLQQAQSEMDGIAAQIARQFPESNGGWGIRMLTFYDWIVPRETRESLLIFMGAVGLVLLIACGNVASLMLARTAARQKEIAVRVALGAQRSRIVRQLLVESLLIAVIAGVLGSFAAWASTRWLGSAGPSAGLPRLTELSVDLRVFGFALAAALTAGVLFGLLPAFQASRAQVSDTLKEGTRSASGGPARQRLRSALVIAEVALSVVLLIGAGLLIRSFWRLQQVQPGFQTERIVTMRVNLPQTSYSNNAKSRGFYERLLPRLAAMPGVQAIATASSVPLRGGSPSTELGFPGRTLPPGVPASAEWRLVSPGYFNALKIPLRGRDFEARDAPPPQPDTAPPPVIIISEAFARRYWPNEDAIGKTVVIKSFGRALQTVVGVAGDVRSFGLDVEAGPTVYASAIAYSGWNPMSLLIRGAGDPLSHLNDVRATVRQIDPQDPIYDVTLLNDALSESLGARRFNMYLLGCFAAIALALACVGLFGVLAYLVSQRTRDIGIRLALGARRADVFRLIVGHGMVLAVAGALLGIGGALLAARVMKSLLFSVDPRDPLTFTMVPLVLLIVAVLACYLPARRALRVDPLVALRAE